MLLSPNVDDLDSIFNYFEVDKTEARNYAKMWWESEGSFVPEAAGPASQKLDQATFSSLKVLCRIRSWQRKSELKKIVLIKHFI